MLTEPILFAAVAAAATAVAFGAGFVLRSRDFSGLLPGSIRLLVRGLVATTVLVLALYLPNQLASTRGIGLFGLQPLVLAMMAASMLAALTAAMLIGYVAREMTRRKARDDTGGAERVLSRMYRGDGGWRPGRDAGAPRSNPGSGPRRSFGARQIS